MLHSAFRIPHSALRRLLALVVAEAFLCSSILPAWATPIPQKNLSTLRPSAARDGGNLQGLKKDLGIQKSAAARDGGRLVEKWREDASAAYFFGEFRRARRLYLKVLLLSPNDEGLKEGFAWARKAVKDPILSRLDGQGYTTEPGAGFEGDFRYYRKAVYDPTVKEGWKLHISATEENVGEILDLVLPVLRKEGAYHKVANGIENLRDQNSGLNAPTQIGKIVAVTADSAAQAVHLAEQIDKALAGRTFTAPSVVTDRALGRSGILFARYGAFQEDQVTTPTGEKVRDVRMAGYYKPPWIPDPFKSRFGVARDGGRDVTRDGGMNTVVSAQKESLRLGGPTRPVAAPSRRFENGLNLLESSP